MNAAAKTVRSFFAFWWDFIVGDDVTLAVGVVLGIAAVAVIHAAGVASWWALPVFWVVALIWSLGRVMRSTLPKSAAGAPRRKGHPR